MLQNDIGKSCVKETFMTDEGRHPQSFVIVLWKQLSMVERN